MWEWSIIIFESVTPDVTKQTYLHTPFCVAFFELYKELKRCFKGLRYDMIHEIVEQTCAHNML